MATKKKSPDAVVVPANRWEVFPVPKAWQKTKMTPVVRAGTTFAVGYANSPKDAALMAAAPEMQEALGRIVDAYGSGAKLSRVGEAIEAAAHLLAVGK